MSAERLGRIDAFLTRSIQAGEQLGAVFLVARHGRIVAWNAHGHARLDRSEPMQRDAIFRIYSMTKPVTSVAALMLLEEGRLQLDDPAARYLPELAGLRVFTRMNEDQPQTVAADRPMTIRHLLIHAAGFASGGDTSREAAALLERAALHESANLSEYVARIGQVPLAAQPGTRFAYDGVNTVVLSAVVERVAGLPFERFVRERILEPLRMTDTGFSVPTQQRARVVELTTTDAEGRLVPSPAHATVESGAQLHAYPSGAGGLYSTAADFARFAQMLVNRGELDGVRLLSRKTVELMMANQLPSLVPPQMEFRPGEGFGLGGFVVTDVASRGKLGSAGQFGWSGAASTYFFVDPSEQLVGILLMQHLPQGLPRDPPRMGAQFYNLVYQTLID